MQEKIVCILFGKSKSSKYSEAVNLIAVLPGYKVLEGNTIRHYCEITTIKDYIKHQIHIKALIDIICSWKDSEILFYNDKCRNSQDIYRFNDRLKNAAGRLAKFLDNSSNGIAMNTINYESLPLPVVYYPNLYGAFFAFSRDIDDDIFFCECERIAIEKYIRLRKNTPLVNYTGSKKFPLGTDFFPEIVADKSCENRLNPLSKFKFMPNICFKCNNKVPELKYCHSMYGSTFMQHYGWYIKQKYFEYGIDPYQVYTSNILEEGCPANVYDAISKYIDYMKKNDSFLQVEDIEDYINTYKKAYEQAIENNVRKEFGFKAIGEAWASETVLFYIIKQIFSNYEIKRHYRPKWLQGLELDIFIPKLSIAFEYQGIQHYKPVAHWGGEQQLKKQQEHDERKKMICLEKNIELIIVDYNEELSEKNIRSKINKCNVNVMQKYNEKDL